jgi:hypothetical protein
MEMTCLEGNDVGALELKEARFKQYEKLSGVDCYPEHSRYQVMLQALSFSRGNPSPHIYTTVSQMSLLLLPIQMYDSK